MLRLLMHQSQQGTSQNQCVDSKTTQHIFALQQDSVVLEIYGIFRVLSGKIGTGKGHDLPCRTGIPQ